MSTRYLRRYVGGIYLVHDQLKSMSKHPETRRLDTIRTALDAGKLSCHCLEVGPVRAHGMPLQGGRYLYYSLYTYLGLLLVPALVVRNKPQTSPEFLPLLIHTLSALVLVVWFPTQRRCDVSDLLPLSRWY